jgi:hypothetical protein
MPLLSQEDLYGLSHTSRMLRQPRMRLATEVLSEERDAIVEAFVESFPEEEVIKQIRSWAIRGKFYALVSMRIPTHVRDRLRFFEIWQPAVTNYLRRITDARITHYYFQYGLASVRLEWS